MQEWYNRLRINTLALVKNGFSREEVFFMPISEMNDYIRLINKAVEEENNEINNTDNNESSSINDIKMAGNMF
jgi:hypothetical protein